MDPRRRGGRIPRQQAPARRDHPQEGGHSHPGRYGAGTYRRRPAGVGQPRPGTAAGDGQRPDAAPEDHGGIRTGHDRRHGAHGRRPQSLPRRERQQMAGDHRAVDTRVQGFGHGQQHRQHDGGQRGGIPHRRGVPGRLPLHGTIGIERQRTDAGNHRRGQLGRRSRGYGPGHDPDALPDRRAGKPHHRSLPGRVGQPHADHPRCKGRGHAAGRGSGRHRRQDRLRRHAIRDRAGGEQPDQPPDRRRESSLPRGGRQRLHPRQHDRRTEDDRPRRRQPGAQIPPAGQHRPARRRVDADLETGGHL